MKVDKSVHKIYALFDFTLNQKKGYSLDAFLALPKVQEATLLQYRDKVNPFKIKLRNILYLKEHTHAKVIANDDPLLAKVVDGLHVGQEDVLKYGKRLPLAIIALRQIVGDKILGLSTHNQKEIEIANTLAIDYIGLGAYRNTTTKDISYLLGEKLAELAALSTHPVAAIGGVKCSDEIAHVSYLVLGSDLYED